MNETDRLTLEVAIEMLEEAEKLLAGFDEYDDMLDALETLEDAILFVKEFYDSHT